MSNADAMTMKNNFKIKCPECKGLGEIDKGEITTGCHKCNETGQINPEISAKIIYELVLDLDGSLRIEYLKRKFIPSSAVQEIMENIYKQGIKDGADGVKAQLEMYEKREQELLLTKGKATQEQIKGILEANKKKLLDEVGKMVDDIFSKCEVYALDTYCGHSDCPDCSRIDKLKQQIKRLG